jgi:hypothetical protein
VSGVAEARRHSQANGARVAADRKAREDRRRELRRRFEQACDRGQVTPPDWLRAAARLGPGLGRATLLAWYRVGELSQGGDGDRLMDLVEAWLKGR